MKNKQARPVVMSIAGSDSGGGAGIQADLLSIHANGAFGTTAITCLTAQNPDGVSAIEVLSASFVREQMQQIGRYFNVKAIKTGMLFNAEIIRTVAEFCAAYPDVRLVVDPVMVATSGAVLLQEDAVSALRTHLLPKAGLITPNLDEAAVLLGKRPQTVDAMEEAAKELARQSQTAVLLKGGHLTIGETLVDMLATPNGETTAYSSPRIHDIHTHGSGCTLASSIAARWACINDLDTAIREALDYIHEGMRTPLVLNDTAFIRH